MSGCQDVKVEIPTSGEELDEVSSFTYLLREAVTKKSVQGLDPCHIRRGKVEAGADKTNVMSTATNTKLFKVLVITLGGHSSVT